MTIAQQLKRSAPGVRRWAQLLVEYALSSGIGQVLGMVAGLIYVRTMPVAEYALYGLCLSTLTFVSIASDFGLTGSASYFWRQCRIRGQAFAPILDEIKRLRRILLWVGSVLGTVVLVTLTRVMKVSALELSVMLTLVIVTTYAMVASSVSQQILRLAGAYRKSYIADVSGQVMRASFALLMLAGVARSALFGLLGGAAAAILTAFLSSRFLALASQAVPLGSAPQAPRREVMRYVLPLAPTVGLFAVQDSAVLWMTAANADQRVVAEVFALGRINAIVGILSAFVVVVMVPRLSGMVDDRRFNIAGWLARMALAVLGIIMVLIATAVPRPILWLLGDQYTHLDRELVVTVAVGAVTLVNTATALLNRARGWVKREPQLAMLQFGIVAMLLTTWSFGSTWHVMLLFLALVTTSTLANLTVSVIGNVNAALVRV